MRKTNSEGYSDPTASKAFKRASGASEGYSVSPSECCKNQGELTDEERRFNKVLKTIFCICDLAGIEIAGQIVLKDKASGRIWRWVN